MSILAPSTTVTDTAAASPREPRTYGLDDYGGHLARLVVLAASFGVGWLLNHYAAGRPYFGFVVLTGVILVCIGLVMGPHRQRTSTQIAIPLFDLAWITFAMYLTDGLSSFLLPMLYVVVAASAVRGKRWEIGTTVAGAITGIFIIAGTHRSGSDIPLAIAQSTLLAAGALAVRLTSISSHEPLGNDANKHLYDRLLLLTSDAVLTLTPGTWRIMEANPAAQELVGQDGRELTELRLEQVLGFKDHAFVQTCRQKLEAHQEVREALTYAQDRRGREHLLRFHMIGSWAKGQLDSIQAVIEIVEDEALPAKTGPLAKDDFSVNYIPSLTHELNNHLAAVRLSAELAATTGAMPDFVEMQQQVDHCQEVLQTVVLQILRSAAPVQSTDQTPMSDLKTVIERCLLLTRPQVLTGGIALEVSLPPDLPEVPGFGHELQEALVRVMLHSIKAMTVQDPPRVLSVVAAVHEHQMDLVITDSSDGLNSRELSVVNGRHVAVSRPEDRTWEIVRDAMCRFGGKIQGSNGLNGGMRLAITLPILAQQAVMSA